MGNKKYAKSLEIIKNTSKKTYDKLIIKIWKNRKWEYSLFLTLVPTKKDENWNIIMVSKKNPIIKKEQNYPTFDYDKKKIKRIDMDNLIVIKRMLLTNLWYYNLENIEKPLALYWEKWKMDIQMFKWNLFIKYFDVLDKENTYMSFLSKMEQEKLLYLIEKVIQLNINQFV